MLEGGSFNDPGGTVRCIVIPNGLDQVGVKLNGVARFFPDYTGISVVYKFTDNIPFCFEADMPEIVLAERTIVRFQFTRGATSSSWFT